MASVGTHSMIERMIRASRLDINMFEEVEADTSATNQALDYTSTLRAIAVVLIGFIPYLALMSIAYALLGALK